MSESMKVLLLREKLIKRTGYAEKAELELISQQIVEQIRLDAENANKVYDSKGELTPSGNTNPETSNDHKTLIKLNAVACKLFLDFENLDNDALAVVLRRVGTRYIALRNIETL